jgi:hypothetical protein
MRAILILLALLSAGAACAQPPTSRRPSAPPAAEPCDLQAQPAACSACPSLLAALRQPGPPPPGPTAGGIVWSPLFVAFRLNCQDAGRLLISRGVNPQLGGADGALLLEVAAQHFATADPRPGAPQVHAIEWVDLLAKPRPFDLDGADPGLPTARTEWDALRNQGLLPPGASAVWSRILAASAAYPVLPAGAERISADRPAPDTGITRPSETAVSRGVEAMLASLDHGGMAELTARVQACWAEPRPAALPQPKWRWHIENCAAMDMAAALLDTAMAPELGAPRQDFFMDGPLYARLAALEQLRDDGLQPLPYLRALQRSVKGWLPIQIAIRSKD